MDCKTFQSELPDLVLTPGARPSAAAVAHLKACPPCAEEYVSFQQTFAALDSWHAPEPSPYFDQKLSVRLREEQLAPRMGFFEGLFTRMTLNTGRNFRPAMAGVLALALVAAGGGSYVGLSGDHSPQPVPQASAAVNDLQILDRNEQAFQQLDVLQQDEDNSTPTATSPDGTPIS
jgi:anti-sigma factor RsiW